MRGAGIAWREELSAGIIANLDEIEGIELIAERYLDAPRRKLEALRFLAHQRPVWIHATSLGLASSTPVEKKQLERLARLIDAIEPAGWSEHLAFVRGGGREIGHLAAPPRNAATLEGLCRNLELARSITGSLPVMENVASVVDPPFSRWSEAEWLARVADASRVDFLFDLHNLHTNTTNFGEDPDALIDSIPPGRIRLVHLAGGRMINGKSGPRVLDDHRSDVPEPVFELLARVALRPDRFDVIVERDGAFPPVDQLVSEVRRARKICERSYLEGERKVSRPAQRGPESEERYDDPGYEDLLAAIFTDEISLDRFAAEPARELARRGLITEGCESIDIEGLELAAKGFARKRADRAS